MFPLSLVNRGVFSQIKRERCYGYMSEENESHHPNNTDAMKSKLWSNISKREIALLSAIGGILLGLVITLGMANFHVLPVQMDNLSEDIEGLTDRFGSFSEEMRTAVDDLQQVDSDFVKDFYAAISMSNGTVVASASQDFSNKISQTMNGPDLPGKALAIELSSETIVAHSIESGEDLKVSDIANHKVLLPYEREGQEVVFYGYINENGCWDGNCIINTYRDDKLELITDAVYLNGKLLSCKQVFYYEMSSGDMVWAYADRLSEESFSTGETWLYTKEQDFYKDFKLNDVTKDDVLTADGFREEIWDNEIAYYYGNTADGYFNDTTGNAYMIHYFEDGSIKLLYSGNFVNGRCDDSTGDAWHIVREVDTKYMCYKGPFKDNKEYHTKSIKSFRSPLSSLTPSKLKDFWDCWNDSDTLVFLGNALSREDIDLIIGDKDFGGNGVLNWGYLDNII